MGYTDQLIIPIYQKKIKPEGATALLGSISNKYFEGDLYDLQLDNWEINSNWKLPKTYDTIICTRTAYFAKDPKDFLKRCYDSLNDNGTLYVDWGYGDHFRFSDYKIGWKNENEHEHAHAPENYLWSGVWDDSILESCAYKDFVNAVESGYDYKNVKEAIFKEIPSLLTFEEIKTFFKIQGTTIVYNEMFRGIPPQLYILFRLRKK